MGTALIGALKVSLGLDSAQFSAGLKTSQANLAKFGKTVAVGFTAVAAAATAAGAAMGIAVKGAIDHADELGKVSQKIGISVEALSRLEYAAKLSDVELEGLTTGMRKFSQVLVEAAGNSKSGPANVFSALGISIKDAAGNMRGSDQIFADVAERFARMEDGALKTSLAVQLFGKSGADLIPLLNSGRDGLKQMADESDRLGATISTKTAKAAEKFNDTLTKIGAILQGVVNKVMEGALPALQSLADMLASPAFQQAAQQFGASMVSAFTDVITWIGQVQTRWQQFMTFVATQGRKQVLPLGSANIEDRTSPGWMNNGEPGGAAGQLMLNSTFGALGTAGTFGSTGEMWKSLTPKTFAPVLAGAGAAKTAVTDLMAGIVDAQPKVENFAETISDSLASSFTNFADAVLSGVPAVEALSDVLGNLGKQLLNSAISNFFGGLFGGGGGLFKPAPKLGVDYGMGLFANGGITNQPAIFGDAGPEAAVPLPDGRSIPVTLSGNTGGTVNNYYIDAKGAEIGVEKKIVQAIQAMVPGMIKTQAPTASASAQRDRRL